MLAGTSRSWLVGGAVVAASILGAFPLPCGTSPARETALSEAEARWWAAVTGPADTGRKDTGR